MVLAAINYETSDDEVVIEVNDGESVKIGRNPEVLDGENAVALRIPWSDRLVSRNHCIARREGDRLIVERLAPLPGRGKPNVLYTNRVPREREALSEPFVLEPGDSAVIGAKGNTALFWLETRDDLESGVQRYQGSVETAKESFESSTSLRQDYDEVEQLDEYSLRVQLKLLQRELPEQVLAGWTNRQELFERAGAFIEKALPGQKNVSAAFLAVDRNRDGVVQYEMLNAETTERLDFRPSRTLLTQLRIDDPVPGDVHIWTSREDDRVFRADSLNEEIDWVAAVPVAPYDDSGEVHRDRDKNRPVYLYVETRDATENSAAVFLPFLRLIAALIASLLSARDQQRIQDRMATFFSPNLRRLMQDQHQGSLEPAMADCSVMFADRRGSSYLLEHARTDQEILDRLKENQEIVGEITEVVFENNGVITDFSGDGVLSLWGWPTLGRDPGAHARQAVNSAEKIVEQLSVRGQFEAGHNRFMAAIRLGVSTGRIAVGKTGPAQQWHISVFGGVANLGARLERIAKEFKLPLLISGETYQRVRDSPGYRFRKLCLINPAGFTDSYPIYELILPKEWGGSGVSSEDVMKYEEALNLFVNRHWDGAIDLLNSVSPEDEPARWLRERAEIFRIRPPGPDWRGEIVSLSK